MKKLTIYMLQLSLVSGLVACKDNSQNDKTKICDKTNILADSIGGKIGASEELTLIFGGDVMVHAPQITAAKKKDGTYDFSGCFKHIKPYWESADAVILNLETTLSASRYSGYPMFSAPYQLAKNLKNSGATHLVTANNHTCDKGVRGIDSTIYYLNKAGLIHTGSFKDSVDYKNRCPMYIEKGSFKVAVLNYTYGTNGMPIPKGKIVPLIDTTQIKKDIAKAKNAKSTNIVSFMHWGDEYKSAPNSKQRNLAKWLHKVGVDIVIGSHPHVVEPIEYYVGGDDISGVTVYSLGNLISNQRDTRRDGGINVKLKITRKDGESKYIMRYKSWYVDKKLAGGHPRYILIGDEIEGYKFDNKSDSLKAEVFFRDTKKLLGTHFEQ